MNICTSSIERVNINLNAQGQGFSYGATKRVIYGLAQKLSNKLGRALFEETTLCVCTLVDVRHVGEGGYSGTHVCHQNSFIVPDHVFMVLAWALAMTSDYISGWAFTSIYMGYHNGKGLKGVSIEDFEKSGMGI